MAPTIAIPLAFLFHLLQAATHHQFCTCAGDTYSTDKVQAQLGRDWGLELGSAIQPRIYTHSSTAGLELPESSSVRALAGQPVLSDLFVPFRQPGQVSFSWYMQRQRDLSDTAFWHQAPLALSNTYLQHLQCIVAQMPVQPMQL